jgi:hypothetical protein
MEFYPVEIVNILLVVVLLILIINQRGSVALLLVLFLYGTLHFSFAVIPLMDVDHDRQLKAMHVEGSGWIAKLSALSLLLTVFYVLSRRAYFRYLSCHKSEKETVYYILIMIVTVFCGYMFNIRTGDWMQLKNLVSIEAMLFLVLIGFLGTGRANNEGQFNLRRWYIVGLIILGAMTCIAITEVLSQRAWAGYPSEIYGAMIYRSSSTLFNPNLLGFWASLVYLVCILGLNQCSDYRPMIFTGMILVSVLIYFSGSRSALLFLMVTILFSGMLIKGRVRWLSLLTLPLTLISIYTIVQWLVIPLAPSIEGWGEIAYLGERLSKTPIFVTNYVFTLVGSSIHIPVEISKSIEGRFEGSAIDSGWIVLYRDFGWLGLVAILWLYLVACWRGIVNFWATRSATSVFTLSALIFSFLCGWVMRFQVFPVWLFTGLIFIFCLKLCLGSTSSQEPSKYVPVSKADL